MNLLEKCKEIIKCAKEGYYKDIAHMKITQDAPAICQAILDVMDEIDQEHDTMMALSNYGEAYKQGVRFAQIAFYKRFGVKDVE